MWRRYGLAILREVFFWAAGIALGFGVGYVVGGMVP